MDTAFEPNRRRLLDFARGLLGTQADAEDCVQDAWLRACAGRPTGLASADAWMHTVVRHLAFDRLRRLKLEREWLAASQAEPQPAPSAEQQAAQAQELSLALRRLVRVLSPAEAAAWLLREVFDADHAEIARSAGRSEVASRQWLRRAGEKLRRGLDRDDEGVDALLRTFVQSIAMRDPQVLHALLRQPAVQASAAPAVAAAGDAPRTRCTMAQVGGRYALVLELDGQVLCTLPVGVEDEALA